MNVTTMTTIRRVCAYVGRLLPVFPAAAMAVLSTLGCPGCWPAYAAVLSAVGLGSFMEGPHVPYVTGGLLAAALVPPGLDAARGHGMVPLLLGILAVALVVVGNFVLGSAAM